MYLVTGATGHIGNTLIRHLLERNPDEQIRAFVLPNSDIRALEDLSVEIFYGNILDADAVAKAMQDVELVFHLAGIIAIRNESASVLEAVNIQGSVNVAEAALAMGVHRMVHVGSVHIFERIPTGVIDESIPLVTKENAAGFYDYTKAEAVRRVLSYVEAGLDVVIACPTGVLGPNDYLGSEIAVPIRRYMNETRQADMDGGYDWVDVRDVADGLIQLAEKGKTGELYLLSGHYISMKEFGTTIGKLLNKQYQWFYVPYWVLWCLAHVMSLSWIFNIKSPLTPYSLKTIRDNANISHEKASSTFAYSPRSLEETFRDTIDWQIEYNNLGVLAHDQAQLALHS